MGCFLVPIVYTRVGSVTLPSEKVTFSGEKVVFRNEKVTFSALKVILSCIDMRIIMHSCYTGHEAFLFGGLNQKK